MSILKLTSTATMALLALPIAASAAVLHYEADLVDINNLGAGGRADLSLDDVANTLKVRIQAFGLAPDLPHVQHIHGILGGNSVTPTAAQDTDGDGFIELTEGAVTYGPIIFSLTDDTMPGLTGFPTAPGGIIDFSFTYDLLTTSAFNTGMDLSTLLPLQDREIVIHGALLPFAIEDQIPGLGGGVLDDGFGNPIAINTPAYNAALPVLAGEIRAVTPVPLPAAGWLLLAGLGALGLKRRRG